MKPADAPHESHLWKRLCLVLPVVALVVLLYGLGSRPFLDYDEAIYARVMDDTARSGQSVTLISDGAAFYDKPPLYFWLGMAARGMFGSAEFAYRLPSALAGVVCVVLVMLIAFEINRRYRTAWIAGVVLLTTPLIFDAARQVRIDVLLTAGILFSFYAFLKGLKKPAWFLGVGVGMAVGLLTKNVVGLFSVFPILVWAFVHRQYAWLRAPYFWMSMALFLVLAAPWHVVETYLYGRTFWDNYLVFHVLERFASNVNGGSARGPGYYVHFLATFAFPWIWISAICAAALYRIRRDARSYVQPVLAIGGSVCALAGIFFVAESKLLHYMIPALAFLMWRE
jgi:4-amino-4-deoxy-L-arabinose transferase-like glycosyltransferase